MPLKPKIFLLLLILALTPSFGSTDQSRAATITPEAIFNRYILAIGGSEAVQQLHNAHLKMEIYFDAYSETPNFWSERFEDETGRFYDDLSDKNSEWRAGFDGKNYWFVTLSSGNFRRLGDGQIKQQFQQILHSAVYVGVIRNIIASSKSTQVLGAAMVANAKTVVVRAISPNGDSSLYYFDGNTGLLIRTDVPVRLRRYGFDGSELNPGKDESWAFVDTCSYTQYEAEPQSHVLFPREIRCTANGIDRIYRVTKIKPNIAIDPKKFAEPSPR